MSECPCGSQASYQSCCEVYHLTKKSVPTAEALMRARYSAYAKGNVDFIESSYHPEKRSDFDRKETERWAKSSKWHGLNILKVEQGSATDREGVVEFVADYDVDGDEYHHHERALFKKENGEWYFFDGKILNDPITRSTPKVGRNDPCPCGSGKKYKKCCLK